MKAAFIGRFQPFHSGHHRVVDDYRGNYDEFVLVIGSPTKSRTEVNPLTASEREEIIRSCFPEIQVVELEDEGPTEEDNKLWAEKLEEVTGAEVILSQNELVKRLVREYTGMDLVEQELYDPERFSGTEIRRRMREGEDWEELVPECAAKRLEEYAPVIRST